MMNWTAYKIKKLTFLYKEHSASEVARMLGTSTEAIKSKIGVLGLKKGKRTYTAAEDERILRDYPTRTAKELAEALNRTVTSIHSRAGKLGVKKDPEVVMRQNQELGRALAASPVSMQSRFSKGSVPATKGKKQCEYMSAEAIERTKNTRFKKGERSSNELHDGAITIHRRYNRKTPPYKWIRISKNSWQMLHIHNWTKANGPVPEGHVVAFKTADTMNCDVANLFLITTADNMARNTIHRYPDDIKNVIRTLGKIKQKLQKYEQH